MKYKYVVFCPYFGKLPKHFNLWLISCSYNKHFKFIVFTDDNVTYSIPKNVEIVQLSFDQFVQEIQKKFDFQISLCHPYKLCDFKPAYGYIFDKYLNNCKYWGYCDLDLIFGNLEKFLPTQEYDKISYLGHLCLMKNIKDSELKNILPIDLINFDESNIKSQKSLLIEACKLWDCGYKAFEIVDELHIHKSSLSRYLKTGQKYGLCHEYSTKNSSARSIGRKVVCVNTAEIFNTIKDAEEYYNVNGIGNCCEGKTYSAGKHKDTNEKLYWLFYEDYQQMSEDDIKEFLLNKLEYERINENFGKAVVCITTG